MNKLSDVFSKFLRHELVSGSLYVFIGTTLSSVLAFFLNLFFARNLSYSEYGVYASLVSLLTLFVIPTQSLAAIVVRYATGFFAKNEVNKAGALYVKSFKYLIFFSVAFNIAFILFSPLITNFLKIQNVGLILLVGASVAIFYIATLNLAFIQSLLRFKLLGVIYTIAGVGKLIAGVSLVLMGFNVYGAILATFIFSFLDFIFSLFPLRKVIKNAGENAGIGIKAFSSYAIPTSVAVLSLSSFISTDVLLVKHFFGPVETGLYGGLSLIGKVIFYFTGPIAVAMFPLIVKRHEINKKYNGLFYLSILLVLSPSVIITFFYFLFPQFIIKLFLGGGAYLTMAPYLGLFGVFLTLFSVNNLFVSFFLSIKKTGIAKVVFLAAIVQITAIFIFYSNFLQIIYVSIITSLLLLGLLVIYYLKLNRVLQLRAIKQ